MTQRVRMALIGCGSFAQIHLARILKQQDTTEVVALCDATATALDKAVQQFVDLKLDPPPTYSQPEQLLAEVPLDAVLIVTPHVFHHDHATLCMESGLDVLLEKPMAMNADEARSLIETRDRTGQLLVIAFPGSLSPAVRLASKMLRSGELGKVLNISAVVWQNWKSIAVGRWRSNPAMSGGGFMFDTGAHVLNTVTDLAGEGFAQVAAWFDNRGTDVDILMAGAGRLKSGAMVTINGCGDTINVSESDMRIFCERGILQIDVWGEYLKLQAEGSQQPEPVDLPPSLGVWEQFLAVRRGEMPNPCPPEVGLRMAKLWDAIRESAAQNGQPVAVDEM